MKTSFHPASPHAHNERCRHKDVEVSFGVFSDSRKNDVRCRTQSKQRLPHDPQIAPTRLLKFCATQSPVCFEREEHEKMFADVTTFGACLFSTLDQSQPIMTVVSVPSLQARHQGNDGLRRVKLHGHFKGVFQQIGRRVESKCMKRFLGVCLERTVPQFQEVYRSPFFVVGNGQSTNVREGTAPLLLKGRIHKFKMASQRMQCLASHVHLHLHTLAIVRLQTNVCRLLRRG